MKKPRKTVSLDTETHALLKSLATKMEVPMRKVVRAGIDRLLGVDSEARLSRMEAMIDAVLSKERVTTRSVTFKVEEETVTKREPTPLTKKQLKKKGVWNEISAEVKTHPRFKKLRKIHVGEENE